MGINKQNEQIKALNAKKLDINFDNDDFFNSFEPTTNTQSSENNNTKNKYISKLKEVNDPFEIAPKATNK